MVRSFASYMDRGEGDMALLNEVVSAYEKTHRSLSFLFFVHGYTVVLNSIIAINHDLKKVYLHLPFNALYTMPLEKYNIILYNYIHVPRISLTQLNLTHMILHPIPRLFYFKL